jgi:hypothetical protein
MYPAQRLAALATGAGGAYVPDMRWVWLVLGILLILAGGVWTLQGLGVLGGSAMSNDTKWAVIGPIVALVGLVLTVIGARARARRL